MYKISSKIKESDYGVDFGESGLGHTQQNGGLLSIFHKTKKKNKYKKRRYINWDDTLLMQEKIKVSLSVYNTHIRIDPPIRGPLYQAFKRRLGTSQQILYG